VLIQNLPKEAFTDANPTSESVDCMPGGIVSCWIRFRGLTTRFDRCIMVRIRKEKELWSAKLFLEYRKKILTIFQGLRDVSLRSSSCSTASINFTRPLGFGRFRTCIESGHGNYILSIEQNV
jgi:hypothetical protein